MYRFERVLRGLLKVKVQRRRRWVDDPVPRAPGDVLADVEEAGALIGVLETDGLIDQAALDAFELRIRGLVRGALLDTAVIPTVFNGMARELLHDRNYANRRDGTVARGIHAATLLAVEERLIMALAVEVAELAARDHSTFPEDLDLGDRWRLRKGAGGPPVANDDEPGGVLDAAE